MYHEFNFSHNLRQLHNIRDDMYKSKTALEKEVSSLREANQMITLKLNTAENKISSLEAEVCSVQRIVLSDKNQIISNVFGLIFLPVHKENLCIICFSLVVTNSEHHVG